MPTSAAVDFARRCLSHGPNGDTCLVGRNGEPTHILVPIDTDEVKESYGIALYTLETQYDAAILGANQRTREAEDAVPVLEKTER